MRVKKNWLGRFPVFRGNGLARHPSQGFTLIEILIVILIISIVSTVAVVTLSVNQYKQYEQVAAELTNLIQLAEEESLLRPATLGLAFSSHSFQFFMFQKKWQPVSSSKQSVFRRQFLPNQTEISVFILNNKQPNNGKPYLIITGSDLTPFKINIGKKDHIPSYQVIGNANGEVYYQPYVESE